jgi:hypothetical protein
MVLKKLPVGIENFEKIRTQGFYYVDKPAAMIYSARSMRSSTMPTSCQMDANGTEVWHRLLQKVL